MANRLLSLVSVILLSGGGYFAYQAQQAGQDLRAARESLREAAARGDSLKEKVGELEKSAAEEKKATEKGRNAARRLSEELAAARGEAGRLREAISTEREKAGQLEASAGGLAEELKAAKDEARALRGEAGIIRAELATEREKAGQLEASAGGLAEELKAAKARRGPREAGIIRAELAAEREKAGQLEASAGGLAEELKTVKAEEKVLREEAGTISAELAAERENFRKATASYRADLVQVRRSLVGTATSAEERRRKLNEARAMLKRMADDRRSASDRAQAFEARAKKEARRAKELENRLVQLQSRLESQEVTVRKTREQLQIDIIERLLFDSGGIRIKEDGRKTLDRIGEILKDLSSRMIRIEGHTDNVPISGALSNRYPTNWELSTARATAVVRHLQGLGIPPEQLSAAGYASYQPVGDNDTPEGRSRNRRIVILLSRRGPTN